MEFKITTGVKTAMEQKLRFNQRLAAGLLTIGLITISTPIFAGNTLDGMNALAPAPLSKTATSNRPIIIPDAPKINAQAFVLIDANSHKIIASENADTHRAPASLTKLMTLYVAFDALKHGQIKLDDKVTVSKKAWQTGGSRMFLNVGQVVTVKDLIQGIIVDSGNDAAVALAEYIGGSEDAFTSIMNQEAQRIGMTESHFTDANGLPHPNHYSSARDLAILASSIVNNFPEYYPFFSEKRLTFNGITQPNRNRLLWRYESADGLKTGHTKEAGYCLVSSAKQNGMRLISVVMGAPTDSARAADSIKLLTYGFRFYKTYKLYGANEKITDARIWKGEDKKIPAGLSHSLYVTVPVGQYGNLAANAVLNNPISAPVSQGQQLGMLDLTLNNKPYKQTPLVALKDDPKGGIWRQFSDTVSRSIHNMFNRKKKEDVTTADANASATKS